MAQEHGFPLVSYQPFRLIFKLTYTATIILRLPYYALRAAVPFLRQHPAWSAKQSFLTLVTYPLLDLASRIGITDTLTLEQGQEGKRFQLVRPSASGFYKGVLASETVKPAIVGGTWYPTVPGQDIASKTVFLYFHGGAYVQGDGRDAQCGQIAKKLLDKGGAGAIFVVQYRLSGYGGQNPFPAALQDALSGYLFLLDEMKIPASQIVVAGDSAGGHLAIALLTYIKNFTVATGIPAPKCAVLLSPWVEPFYFDMQDNPNRGTDFVPASYAIWGAKTCFGSRPDPRSDPYITQLGHPFPTSVPIFVNAGSAEIFYGRVVKWADEMRKVPSNVVEIHHEEAAIHDTFLLGEMVGFEKSAWDVAAKVGEFVRKH
ncbi:alpha/beta hydrolase fold-3 domain-containing protein [Xylaria intraflava]|nr:alpha/beta hydrolase fold-3 domain-containing protein [Xylaria intraflava]